MKILLISIGTRGDIEPFLAQAEILRSAGHEVFCLFPDQFREIVEKLGFAFLGFDRRFLELLESDSGKSVMGGGGNFFSKIKNFYLLIRNSFGIQGTLLGQQKEAIDTIKPDRVIFHPKALYCTLPAMAKPKAYFQLSPIPNLLHPNPLYPHLGLSKWKPFSQKWNLLTYDLINGARYLSFNRFLKPYYPDFPGFDFSVKAFKRFEANDLQVLYQISPTLYPKPSTWPKTAYITGFFARNQNQYFKPDFSLVEWLEKYPKAALLTFGSMTNPKPLEYSQKIIGLLEKHQIPTIVNLSWGGLQKLEGSSDSIYYVNQIPYDWIFPRMHGVIHHGGSGTTHSAAKSGSVQLIVPHIMDQYFWNRLIFSLRLGPLGNSIHNFDPLKFELALLDFWNNPEYKAKAVEISKSMADEANPQHLIKLITQE